MAKKYPLLGKTLKILLFNRDMKPADLSREINIPQATIHRLITGKSTRPYKSSLQPIADFFEITVEQLLGEEALPQDTDHNLSNNNTLSNSKIQLIPLMEWENIDQYNSKTSNPNNESVPFVGNRIENAFATILQDSSMEPQFSKGNTLIFDQDKPPSDRSYVLAKLTSNNVFVFRQLLIDADHQFLKPLNPDLSIFKMRLLEENDLLIATLVEARQTYKNK